MAIVRVTRARCRACDRDRDRERECQLVQSINTRTNPDAKTQLLAGELNVLACPCGRRTQLAATVLFHDPDADYWCQVCPGGEQAMAEGDAALRVAGVSGRQRLVPSLNALVEKIKLLDAGLEDWAIEMAKVLLLASLEDRPELAPRGPPPRAAAPLQHAGAKLLRGRRHHAQRAAPPPGAAPGRAEVFQHRPDVRAHRDQRAPAAAELVEVAAALAATARPRASRCGSRSASIRSATSARERGAQ